MSLYFVYVGLDIQLLFCTFLCVHTCNLSFSFFFFFFFFQAEDGIRDVAVTGVQTCALPISDIESLDLFYGPGGSEGAPDLTGKFTYVSADNQGTQKKIYVKDDKDREWTEIGRASCRERV